MAGSNTAAQPSAFPPGRWQARWIWADPSSAAEVPKRHAVALRHAFELDVAPAEVPLRAFAVSRYVLRCNGVEVSRGPSRANPRDGFWDELDVAPFLRPGGNVLAAIAVRYEHSNAWYLPPPERSTDLAAGAFVLESSVARTDETWTATVLDGWTATRGRGVSARGRELADLRSLPGGWDDPDGDDPGWPAAVVRRAMAGGESGPPRQGPPTYPIGPHERRRTTARPVVPIALDRSDGGDWVADRIVVGTIALEVDGPPGAEVVVQAAEMLTDSGTPRATEHDASIAFTLDGRPRVVESFDAFGLRALSVRAPDGVDVRRVEVRERLHPVVGGASFACSDPRLDRIYEIGRRTVSICSLDSYVDCPTREQRAWAGDSVVHQMVDLTTNEDWTLARWHPRLTAGCVRSDGMLPMAVAGDVEFFDFTVIPDWALHWIHSVWNLYRYVGDGEEVAGLLPVVESVCRWFDRFRRPDGLLVDVHGWCIIDWAAVQTRGVSGAMNALWARALLELAELADWLGDGGRSAWARGRHAALVDGFEALWDPGRDRYVDSIVGGERRPSASQHTHAAALLGGLVPGGRVTRVVDVLTDRARHVDAAFGIDGPATPGADLPIGGVLNGGDGNEDPWWDAGELVVRAQPFYRYVVHDALVAAGRADLIASQCLDWEDALVRSDTSWTETWYGGTVSHGWSSTPTRDLVQRVLGITPAEPGFAVVRVDPALGDLEWARGSAPTPAGLVSVEASADGALTVDSPLPIEVRGNRYPAGRRLFQAPAPT